MVSIAKPLFPLGRVVSTPACLDALIDAKQTPAEFLLRHQRGDWGIVDDDDAQANDDALKDGSRILSAYLLATGVRIWIITEADRSVSTLLLPSDY